MSENQQRVAIITDDPGWHGRELVKALNEHGLGSRFLSLIDCQINIGSSEQDVSLPGFDSLPFGVFVRGVPGGSLEQVIFRIDVLHALQELGVTVFNTPRAIERTVDKPLTSLIMKHAGIPTPPTWICESVEHAKTILQKEIRFGNKLVLKPLFGSQGIGVHLITDESGLVHDDKFAGVYYLQRYIERKNNEFNDIRVLVINGKAKAAMLRKGETWLTNRAQGASCEPIKLDGQLTNLAETACKVLNIDYAGVDLMQDNIGNYYVIEVNSIPAWYGLQKVADFNIASEIIHAFVKRISENSQLKVCSN